MASVTTTPADDRVATRSAAAITLGRPEVGALIGAVTIAVLFLVVAPAFRHVANIGTILYGSSTIGIMAVAVALLMIGGEFDLSAGVAVTTSGLTAAHIAWYFGLNVWVGIFLALLVSLGIGAFNGWLLHRTGLPSFLVTLGSFFVLQGVNLAVTRLVAGGVSSNSLGDMDGFESAKAVFASSFSIGPVNIVQSGQGVGNEFIYIISAVIGGCLLTGGYGSVVGATVGALIFGMTQLGISYAGWDPDWFKTFLGIMLILATVVNLYIRKKANAR